MNFQLNKPHWMELLQSCFDACVSRSETHRRRIPQLVLLLLLVFQSAHPAELRVEEFGNRHWRIQACSAVRGDGLVAGMKWVVQDVASRIFMLQ